MHANIYSGYIIRLIMDFVLLGLCLIGCVTPLYGYHTTIDYIYLDFNLQSCQNEDLGETSKNHTELYVSKTNIFNRYHIAY